MTRFKWMAALAVLSLVLGAAPALADEGEETEDTEESAADSPLATLLTTEYGISPEDIAALLEAGFGFGEIFKLQTMSLVTGLTIDDLLAGFEIDPETGEVELDWGVFKKSLTDEQLAIFATLAKNFGQLVSESKRHHGRDEHQPEHAKLKSEAKGGNGHQG